MSCKRGLFGGLLGFCCASMYIQVYSSGAIMFCSKQGIFKYIQGVYSGRPMRYIQGLVARQEKYTLTKPS